MIIDMVLVHIMQPAIMNIINMITVRNGFMATTRAVYMITTAV